MKKFIVAVSLLLVGAGVAVAKGSGGGAVVVGTAVGVGVSARASNFQNGTFFLSNRNGGYWLLPLASFQGRFWPQNSGVA